MYKRKDLKWQRVSLSNWYECHIGNLKISLDHPSIWVWDWFIWEKVGTVNKIVMTSEGYNPKSLRQANSQIIDYINHIYLKPVKNLNKLCK